MCQDDFSLRNLDAVATGGLGKVNLHSHGNSAGRVPPNREKKPEEPWEKGMPRLCSTRRPGKQWGGRVNLQRRRGKENELEENSSSSEGGE